ncbi:tRNA 2-thiouridine(34) synthase MnmA [Tissierella pigra]|uniref:tRNA-specific 2-thiouridylase MnmA n=1 Tax=Tissierella pigra TaxID=2607614 RepID=A0A6N7XZR2_9FIRM|nr:tRNA 2-thiouridine(34) synthase MnmA [Tissierella pigra]MBU5426294.1 tRNA 2-thiouridine(34) synthase MnmA [Tissierella pigra]MSU01280.1 tRNA 2-thiouridine(34) synthase MnmA [Tissierella pigra]
MKKRVILGMSGGVDSSVAALLLKEAGYEVIGLFMKNWDEKDEDGVCTATIDSEDARQVADQLEIPFYTINFEKEYWDRVFTYFLDEYKKGRTPNPDVMCNQEIKFNAFLDYALKLDADYIAMGHYAQVEKRDGKSYLIRGNDNNKDQSYFLSRIDQSALSKTLFPIGHLEKKQVRELAEKHNLTTASKKDSTGICFIGERDFDEFLDKYLLTKEGDIIDIEGNKIGKHSGLIHYTLGQRKGIGIGGVGTGEPWFVAGKDLKKNILYVAQGEKNPALYSTSLIGETPKWILGTAPSMPLKCTAKFRYRQGDIPVTVNILEDGNLYIKYDYPVKAVTPGQVAVLYQDEVCLGGCIIKSIEPLEQKYLYLNTI